MTAIAAASFGSHTVALKSDGTIVGWGSNDWGQLNVPAGLSSSGAVATSLFHTAALVPANKVFQTITFGALANKTYGAADVTISATASSGLAVSFATGAGDTCTSVGATLHLTGAGSCTVTASQAGTST